MNITRHPGTLFARTGLTLATALGLFLVFTIVIVVMLVLVPVGKQGADDLAVLMIFAAETWAERPAAAQPDFEQELINNYDLMIIPANTQLPAFSNPLPWFTFLQNALQRRLDRPVVLMQSKEPDAAYWADIPLVDHRAVRVGFPAYRFAAHPPLAILLLLLTGMVTILFTSILLARYQTRPLVQLSRATEQIAGGRYLEPLRESGPQEIATLIRSFNRMSEQISGLLANRTTLLAGISHDLRTPITRVRLALELFPPGADADLLDGIHRDLEEMDRLIGQALELAKGLDLQSSDEIDLRDFIDGIVADFSRGGARIEWSPQKCCTCEVETLPLRRVISNLIDNAIRYGEDKPVTVQCHCQGDRIFIQVLDRGPGIPVDQRDAVFLPFHRLESSRSRMTGGSGLGLAIARQLCEARGWSIQLLPREGGGTDARLEFPSGSDSLHLQ